MSINPAVWQVAQPILANLGDQAAQVLTWAQGDAIAAADLRTAQGFLSSQQSILTDTAQRRALAWLDIELQKLAQAETPLETRRLQAIDSLQTGATPSRKIAPELLHVTDMGGLVFLDTPTPEGKPRNVVMRTVPWVTKELAAVGGAMLYLVADARLRLSTGRHETDTEFPGYRGTFIDGNGPAKLALFADEVDDFRRILELSFDGDYWNTEQATMAQFYPADQASLVPDHKKEAIELRSKFGVEADGERQGLWDLSHTLERGGRLVFGDIDIVHRGDGLWSLFEGGIYLGDVDYRSYPVPDPRPDFMEAVTDPLDWEIRYRALVEGRPTFVSLGGGAGFTKAKASSHIKIDAHGDVIIWDPNVDVIADLTRLGIPLARVKHIVLSHAHFDHVAGIWQLIRRLPHKADLHIQVNPDDINHITSGRRFHKGMEMSMLATLVEMAVHASHGQVTGAELLEAVNIVPMRFHQNTQIGTYTVQFYHSNHPHPTTPYFLVDPKTGRPTFLFTGDARLNAEALFQAVQKGAMTGARASFLSSLVPHFLLQGAVVVADAGIPPLHPTPAYYQKVRELLREQGLTGEALDEVMTRLHLYHEDREKVEGAGFQHVGWGWRTAIDLAKQVGWTPPREEEIQERLVQRGLMEVALFDHLTVRDWEDLKRKARVRRFARGEALMRQGEAADTMMVILEGAVGVSRQNGTGSVPIGTLNAGLIGEAVFADEKTRNASVEALTDVIVLELGQEAQEFLRSKGVAAKAVDLRKLRGLVDGSDGSVPVLDALQTFTRDMILLNSDVESLPAGDVLMHEGQRGGDLYFLLDGEAEVSTQEGPLSRAPVKIGRGGVLGEGALMGQGVRRATVTAVSELHYIRLSEAKVRELMERSGGDFNYFLLGLIQQRRAASRPFPKTS